MAWFCCPMCSRPHEVSSTTRTGHGIYRESIPGVCGDDRGLVRIESAVDDRRRQGVASFATATYRLATSGRVAIATARFDPRWIARIPSTYIDNEVPYAAL